MKLNQIIIVLLLLTITGISGYGIVNAIELKKTEIHNEAVNGCGTMAIGVKKGEFIPYVYNLCLKDKEIR